MRQRKLFLLFIFFTIYFAFYGVVFASDLNGNGIQDIDEAEVVVSSNVSLPAGEYFFKNLTITNNATLTLIGDPLSVNSFKGVKITAVNLTINSGSSISADEKGYSPGFGPGASAGNRAGASYGGVGGWGGVSIYGSAIKPLDLGSGGPYTGRGGGAVYIMVANVFTNNGIVSANGGGSSSGGSIYVITGDIGGSGTFKANGGSYSSSSVYYGQGGGGRIAIYYQASSFSGQTIASGGCGSLGMGYTYECGGSGTSGLFNLSTNDFYAGPSWHFQKNDEPFNFDNIFISNAAKVTSENGANITANNISINGASIFTLSGNEIINTNNFLITGNSMVSVIPERILTLTIPNITINSGSIISADAKGYIVGPGSPEASYEAGASYGGKGGGATAKPSYGSATAPTDFGSGMGGRRGGGAIHLIANNTFQNDGIVSANGQYQRTSGGSIYVMANKIKGGGAFQANGSNSDWPYGYTGGGGGRIAIYYQDSSFTGAVTALAGVYCFYGCNPAAENGTVLIQSSVPVCTENCFSNILFLPGIMGSRLYNPGLNCGPDIVGPECGEKELWISNNDALQEKLALNIQGKSINNIYTKNDTQNTGELDEIGIVDDVGTFNIYQSFITDLKNWKKDGTIADYDFIPYDWRLSLDDIITNGATNSDNNLSYTNPQNFSESFILKKLEALQKNSKSGKVTIISHSQGGLVAKALIQKLKDTNNPLYDKIDKIIFVAVPQVGTPDAMATLLHGSEIGPAGLIMSNERSRQLSENMSSVYNFLPTASYFTTVDPAFAIDKIASFENKPFFNPQTSQYGVYVSNQAELKNYILGTDGRTKPSFGDTVHPNIGNSLLYAQAENVHQILDAWQPSSNTKVIQVAGWGEETLAGLDYKLYKNFFGSEYFSFEPRWVVDGDGVVVAPSALWMSTSTPNVERWWVDLKNYNRNSIVLRTQHRDILEVSNLRNFIKSKIQDFTFVDLDNIIINNTSTLISNDTRLHYTLHSPLTLGIESQGKYTGMDPVTKQIRKEIPNITYKQIGDVQFISAPADIAYTVKMQGYAEGSFSLDMDKQEGNNITSSTSFQGIPSSVSTLATMEIAPNQEIGNSTLKIDQNGNGNMVKILDATPDGITIYDITSPELQITFNKNTRDVVFSAQDVIDKNPITNTTKDSITLKDNSNNTTIIPFTKYKEKPTKLRFSYNKIIRNGIIVTVPNTSVVYDWQEKKGVLTDLDTKITIKGVEKYTFSYNKASNITTIKEKIGKNITTTKREGFVAVTLKTNEDYLNVSY